MSDPDFAAMVRQPTLELPGGSSTESLEPTNRALKFASPAPTRDETPSPMLHDNQLGEMYPSPPSLPSPPVETPPAETPIPSQKLPPSAPSETGAGSAGDRRQVDGDADPTKGEGRPVILEGTMYEDGTYWKNLNCR